MATVIDSLIVTLGLDPKDFKKGAADAQKAQDDMKASAAAGAKATEEGAAKIGKTTAKVGKARKDEASAQRKRDKDAETSAKKTQAADKQRADEGIAGLKKLGFAAAAAVVGFESLKGAVEAYRGATDKLATLGRFAPTVDTSVEKVDALGKAYEQVGGKADDAAADLSKFAHAQYSLAVHQPDALAGFARRYHVALLDQNLHPRSKEDVAADFGAQIRRATPDMQTQASIAREMGMSESYIQLYVLAQAKDRERILKAAQATVVANKANTEEAKKGAELQAQLDSQRSAMVARAAARIQEEQNPILQSAAKTGGVGGQLLRFVSLPAATLRALGIGDSVHSKTHALSGNAREYLDRMAAADKKFGLPTGTLAGIANTESRFNPHAVNKKSGARGMMQLMPQYFPNAGMDVDHDIQTAGGLMKRLLKKYKGNMQLALAAYNTGEGNVDKAIAQGKKLPLETRNYVPDVQHAAAQAAAFSAGATSPTVGAGGAAAAAGNGKAPTTNVQIDNINIQTQAKDANGIAVTIAPALKRKGVVANANAGMS